MSLMNLWLQVDQATLAVDTEGVTQSGAHRTMSKLVTIPHLPAAIAMRGANGLLAGVLHLCMTQPAESFDALLDQFADTLALADAMLPAHARDPQFADTELVVAGWSDARQRMVARLYTRRGSDETFTGKDSEGVLAPYLVGMPTTFDEIAKIATMQVDWMRRHHNVGGGKLLVATIKRDFVATLIHPLEATCQRSAHCSN